ncbi:MAG TPA: hypothetical protein VJI97_04330 [Candidatus Nanoarchaeia archaeon]|nr:hypothetical protein [Candidatus Nanoarchaeia archaeon]
MAFDKFWRAEHRKWFTGEKMNDDALLNLSGLILKNFDRYVARDDLSDTEVLLLTMYVLENDVKKAGVVYDESKDFFLSLGRKDNNFRVALHRATASGLVEVKEKKVFFLGKGLKFIQDLLGRTSKSKVFLVKSGSHFTAIKLFEEFLQNEMDESEIRLSDPHISPDTLHPFSILKGKAKKLMISTSKVYEEEKFKSYKDKFEKETGISIEVRINFKIHDRWIINGDKSWSIGTSIKDFGNKDTIITDISNVKDSLEDLFNERWVSSKSYP